MPLPGWSTPLSEGGPVSEPTCSQLWPACIFPLSCRPQPGPGRSDSRCLHWGAIRSAPVLLWEVLWSCSLCGFCWVGRDCLWCLYLRWKPCFFCFKGFCWSCSGWGELTLTHGYLAMLGFIRLWLIWKLWFLVFTKATLLNGCSRWFPIVTACLLLYKMLTNHKELWRQIW